MIIFAASNLKFGYPGKFPAREQDHIDTTPNLIKGYLVALYLLYLFVKVLRHTHSLMPIATLIQRLNMLNGKTWVLYFAYPVCGLSHCLASG